MFEDKAVQADSVEDFLNQYYRTRRFTGRGAEYAQALIQSHQQALDRHGYTIISHHESKTDEVVAYLGPNLVKPPEQLYDALNDLTDHLKANGQGRSPEAQHVREYCTSERAQVKAELRRRGLPGTRPGDDRVYGAGRANWQRAKGAQ